VENGGMSGVKIFWGLLIVILGITAGLWLFILDGVGPQPVRHIKLSSFVSPREATNALFLKLRPKMLEQNLFFIGIPGNLNLSLELMEQLQADLPRYLERNFIFLIDEDLEKLYPEVSKFSGQRVQVVRLASALGVVELSKLFESGLSVAVFTQIQTAYSEAPGLAHFWREQGASFNLLFAPLARSKDHEAELYPPCRTGFDTGDPIAKLGCTILQTSRLNYRRKVEPKSFLGLMVQISDRDFLYLLRATEAGGAF
jgi:hypothetical protein